MGNLRERMERDLGVMIEDSVNGFGLPVSLVSPDGERQIYDAHDTGVPQTQLLMGRVVYARFEVTPQTGMPYRVNDPMVTLRKSSLDRVPAAGEVWAVTIPKEPSLTSDTETYIMELAPQSGDSYPWILLVLMKAEQDV